MKAFRKWQMEDYETLFRLYHEEGKSLADAARIMGISITSARNQDEIMMQTNIKRSSEAKYLVRCPVGNGLMLSGVPLAPIESLHPRVQKWLREVWIERQQTDPGASTNHS